MYRKAWCLSVFAVPTALRLVEKGQFITSRCLHFVRPHLIIPGQFTVDGVGVDIGVSPTTGEASGLAEVSTCTTPQSFS